MEGLNGELLPLTAPEDIHEKENDPSPIVDVSKILMQFMFQRVDGCTFIFNFGSK